MQNVTTQRVLVLGAGNFGTCLAQHLNSLGHETVLWSRSAEIAEHINKFHKNPKYLSHAVLAKNLRAVSTLSATDFKKTDIIVLAVPTQALRSVLSLFKSHIELRHLLVSAAKGIEVKSSKLPNDIIAEILGAEIARCSVVLSGPSFASEVIEHQPTGVSMASADKERALWGQAVFHAPYFRVYTSSDIVGLEVAGALKNVIAIGVGACEGLGFQANSRATPITRGLAEMTRFGIALGANPLTFTGLGGVGDLFLTCTSKKSRNFSVGLRLAKGENIQDIIANVGSVAEGISTAKSAYELGTKLGVRLSIIKIIYQVIYEGKSPDEAVRELLAREARDELG